MGTNTESNPYVIRVSTRFLLLSLASSILVAFTVGRAARIILIEGPRNALLAEHEASALYVRPEHSKKPALPTPQLIDGKSVPPIVYSAKTFHTSMGTSSSSAYLENETKVSDKTVQKAKGPVKGPKNITISCKDSSEAYDGQCKSLDAPTPVSNVSNIIVLNETEEEEEEHLPAGQHLLVDIKNVDGNFLDSEFRLAQAMIDVVNDSKLTLLSYHCHKLDNKGVSCVGVLLESHISFHTWPEFGVISLDLFTCGSGELIPILPIVKRLFAVPAPGGDEPDMIWAHKLRGASIGKGVLGDDLGRFVLETTDMDLKREVVTARTDFQRIDIYDTINAHSRDYGSYRASIEGGDTYEAKHPELFTPQTEVYLDGILQSTRYGNEAYHEALVQPAMFIHPNPKRVAIIGGGEGSTLREALKHKSVEKVTMIEIDEKMVQFSKEYIPDWNTCSDIVGSAQWCGDDTRADMRYEDGLAWFHNRFSINRKTFSDEFKEDPFEIVIMDALDPQDDISFADKLYTDKEFLDTLYNSLSDDGILVMQLGISSQIQDPLESISSNEKRHYVLNALESVGFKSLHVYEEGNCGFRWPWTFAIALKSSNSDHLWYRNAAEIDLDITKRLIPTVSGEPALKVFDGATMNYYYQNPGKSTETVYCRERPTPTSCTGSFDKMKSKAAYDPYAMRHQYKLSERKYDFCQNLNQTAFAPPELKALCAIFG
jgi:S-adenosylmethionine decarboxylase proenzyme